MLTIERIEQLSSKKGVRAVAVRNFLFTVGENQNSIVAYANLEADARSYRWNAATVNAICTGIREYFSKFERAT
jgi:hypothetical protein